VRIDLGSRWQLTELSAVRQSEWPKWVRIAPFVSQSPSGHELSFSRSAW